MTISINKQQDIVLKVIQDYLDNNRILEMEKVVPYIKNIFAKSSVNINENGIKNIIQTLIENRFVIQGSKLTKERILKNNNRKRIYYFIKQNPGVISNQISKELQLSAHGLSWHLDVLIKFGCLNKVRIDNHIVYYHAKIKKSYYIPLYLLSNSKVKNIISYFKNIDDSGVNKTAASKSLGIHFNVISKYFDLLEKSGILYKETLSKKKIYFLSDKYYKQLEKFYV